MASSSKLKRRDKEFCIKEEPLTKSKKVNDTVPMPKCDVHSINCTFWCTNCISAICSKCTENGHKKHSLQMLIHVIQDKVRDAISRYNDVTRNKENLSAVMSQCNQQVAFHEKFLRKAEKQKLDCQNINKLYNCVKEYLPSFENLANNADNSSVDSHILGKLLNIKRDWSDFELYEIQTGLLAKVGQLSTTDKNSFSLSGYGATFRVFCRTESVKDFMDEYDIYYFTFRFCCTSASVWPVKASVRIVLTKLDERRGSNDQLSEEEEIEARESRDNTLVTNCHFANDLVFYYKSTVHEIKARSYWSKINYVVEVYPMAKN